MLQGIGSRFDFHVCKTLCDMRFSCDIYLVVSPGADLWIYRTEEIFDIIVDYPDSQGALVDLCVSLLLPRNPRNTNQYSIGVSAACRSAN